MTRGSLTVVGTGIKAVGQVTIEARSAIIHADMVLHHVVEPVSEKWISSLNTREESLRKFYALGKPLIQTYQEMVECILGHVRKNLNVCVAFYGHPGICVYASHESITQARREGYSTKMIPGVSSMDCLFSDLGVDPAQTGCQFLEATDFLVHNRVIDPTMAVILYQVGSVGDLNYAQSSVNVDKLKILVETLQRYYDLDYEVILYEAAQYAVCDPRAERIPLSELTNMEMTSISTLYIPPKNKRKIDRTIIRKLGIKTNYPHKEEKEVKNEHKNDRFFN